LTSHIDVNSPWRRRRTRILEGEGGVAHMHYRVQR
jgi:hypothetical protein